MHTQVATPQDARCPAGFGTASGVGVPYEFDVWEGDECWEHLTSLPGAVVGPKAAGLSSIEH